MKKAKEEKDVVEMGGIKKKKNKRKSKREVYEERFRMIMGVNEDEEMVEVEMYEDEGWVIYIWWKDEIRGMYGKKRLKRVNKERMKKRYKMRVMEHELLSYVLVVRDVGYMNGEEEEIVIRNKGRRLEIEVWYWGMMGIRNVYRYMPRGWAEGFGGMIVEWA